MKKILILAFFVFSCFTSINAAEISPILIKEYDFSKMNAFEVNNKTKQALLPNTAIEIKAIDTLRADTLKVGDRVNFVVNKDVLSTSGNIMIKKGTIVFGEVTSIHSKGKIGKSAILNIGDIYTIGVDNSIITSSSLISVKPKNKKSLSISLSILVCPLFLLMEGKDAVLDVEDIKTIYTRDVNYIKPQI